MTSSRFAVAVHLMALAMLAQAEAEGELLTSERMAESVCTNPVVVRRILGALRNAGLVASQPGPGGGWRLTRAPERITLRDVYRAVDPEPLLALPHQPASASCPVGRHMRQTLEGVFHAAAEAMERKLAEVTVADVLATVLEGREPREPAAPLDAVTN